MRGGRCLSRCAKAVPQSVGGARSALVARSTEPGPGWTVPIFANSGDSGNSCTAKALRLVVLFPVELFAGTRLPAPRWGSGCVRALGSGGCAVLHPRLPAFTAPRRVAMWGRAARPRGVNAAAPDGVGVRIAGLSGRRLALADGGAASGPATADSRHGGQAGGRPLRLRSWSFAVRSPAGRWCQFRRRPVRSPDATSTLATGGQRYPPAMEADPTSALKRR